MAGTRILRAYLEASNEDLGQHTEECLKSISAEYKVNWSSVVCRCFAERSFQ